MSEAARRPFYTLEEYLAIEEFSNVRHEFVDGEIRAMAGGSLEHNRICANFIALVSAALRGRPCAVLTSDTRVRIQATGLDTYPDAVVVCGRAEMDDRDVHALVNPTVVLEVTSRNTEAYDRGEKLEHYRRIGSLQEVVLVSHRERRVEVWRRSGDVWAMDAFAGEQEASLPSLGAALPLAELYRDPLGGG